MQRITIRSTLMHQLLKAETPFLGSVAAAEFMRHIPTPAVEVINNDLRAVWQAGDFYGKLVGDRCDVSISIQFS